MVRLDTLTLPYRDGSALPLVPASAGWQVPALLGFGGWNSCPEPAVPTAVLKYWGERYGADTLAQLAASLIDAGVVHLWRD